MTWGALCDAMTFGPARRRRWMHRQLAALDGADDLAVPGWRTWSPPGDAHHSSGRAPGHREVHGHGRAHGHRPVRMRRRHRTRGPVILTLVTVTAMVAVALFASGRLPLPLLRAMQTVASDTPPIPVDVQRRPLGHPAPAPTGDGGYAFVSRLPGIASGPVTYDPCRPIHLVVNHRYAPAGADRLLDEATREVSRATGLVFALEGPTDEQPHAARPLRDGDRYGNRWSPVLVAWTSPDVVPGLKGDVGLAHVTDPRQLMYAKNSGQLGFADGDLRGLHELGLGRCHFDT